MSFTGFPSAALDFFDDLEVENTKAFWEANRATYESAIKAPMLALTEALTPEFGPAKVFRPYRDVRFAKDKTPYKTHQGAFVGVAPATGWYLELSSRGVRVGAGFYDATGPRLAAIRTGIDRDESGTKLAALIANYERKGWEIGGDRLKTTPRDFPADHPRIDLLRHKQLFVGRTYGFEPEDLGPGLVGRVQDDWRLLRPLVEWLALR